ncbi:MAG TPA: hypothetical protein VIL19_08625 [Casimicrobiaceae bacterium]
MGIAFWVRRFLLVFAIAAVLICVAQLLKGRTLDYSLAQGFLWAAIAASVATLVNVVRSRNRRHCAVCGDAPEASALKDGGHAVKPDGADASR